MKTWPHLTDLTIMSAVVLGLLLLATALAWILKLSKPNSNFKELIERINSWWIMVAFFFGSLWLGEKVAIILFAFFSFLALKEFFTLIQTRPEDHRALFWAYLSIPVQYWLIFIDWRWMVFIFIPVYMFLFTPARLLQTGQTKGIVESMAKIQWGQVAFVFCISHLALYFKLQPNAQIKGGGVSLLLFLVVLTELNDIAQYAWGKLLGKHKISPHISPKKTWAGFIGGVLSTVALAFALQFLTDFKPLFSVLAGLLISLSGFIGDLVLSAVKRDVGVKDASNLIPGHGGILDRIDSLTYTAPLFFHFVSYFFY
jgi:phosphatidate cytidylyltransferase